MALLFEILLWLLVELALQLVGEFLVVFGFESLAQSLGRRERPNRVLAGAGCLILGGLTGGIVTLIYPHHVSPEAALPFLAVVILPLLVGAGAFWLGRRAESAGRPRPALSTFWGGVLFALGMSLTRFLILRAGGA